MKRALLRPTTTAAQIAILICAVLCAIAAVVTLPWTKKSDTDTRTDLGRFTLGDTVLLSEMAGNADVYVLQDADGAHRYFGDGEITFQSVGYATITAVIMGDDAIKETNVTFYVTQERDAYSGKL